jgi:peptidoglycan/xylan/chitin deacetylase (PgdA/CDA1 family)
LSDGRVAIANSIFLYWFIGKDRVTPYHWQRIYWTAKDRVLHNTNHRWAYILIHIPVKKNPATGDAGKSEEETMKVVAGFVQDIYPTLVAN